MSADVLNKLENARWYTSEQVERGGYLFQAHCSECHGRHAESVPEWQMPLEHGAYPPPPLNGTAHAWHHPLPLLRRTIREGGVAVGGRMPPFAGKLSPSEVDAIIAWFQSLWPDEIYSRWSGSSHRRLPQPEFIENLLKDIR